MIRNFFSGLIIFLLICTTGYYWWSDNELQIDNHVLKTRLISVERQLADETRRRHRFDRSLMNLDAADSLNPLQDAQLHLSNAEHSLSVGNIGDAIMEYRLAQKDFREVSTAAGKPAGAAAEGVQRGLQTVHDGIGNLWNKLGKQ